MITNINKFKKINEELINNEFYFYHSSKTLDAALKFSTSSSNTYVSESTTYYCKDCNNSYP